MSSLFLSHSHADQVELAVLHHALELRGVACFRDVRELRAGDRLLELERHVKTARAFLVLVTPQSIGSKWVRWECRWAQEVEGLRIIALVQGLELSAAELLVGEDRLVIPVDGLILDAVPRIIEALSTAPLQGRTPKMPPPPPPRSELVLSFRRPRWVQAQGRRRVHADLEVRHVPAQGTGGEQDLGEFGSPLGPIELGELRWYLEVFPSWSFGDNAERGVAIEQKLRPWGRSLHDATLGRAGALVGGFLSQQGERRVVIEVRSVGPTDDDDRKGAAAALLALPWELLADAESWLFSGDRRIRVVRRLPRQADAALLPLAPRLKVLLVVARTSDAGFIDARASLTPLVDALAPLGHKVELHVLPDGTLTALTAELKAAQDAGRPYQVVHFDGHGVYDAQKGLGLLVFEHPDDVGKLERKSDLVDAGTLGEVLKDYRVPLFVLEACQSAQTTDNVESSVAGRLLRAGVGSVVAMSHSVLVETARRFVGPFYTALAQGRRVGEAMVRGQQALFTDPRRNRPGQREWTLRDWFVPLLFQDAASDVPLLPEGPLPDPDDLARVREARLAQTPEPPAHGFVGRARELLALHRLLVRERAVALLGVGGQGKTALATEAARWLLSIGWFERLAWVSVEHYGTAEVVLDALGRQLVAGWTSVAGADLSEASGHVQRALRDWRVLVVVDNLESVLDDPEPGLLELLGTLAKTGDSRLLLTSREAPPETLGATALCIGPLAPSEGRELVAGVLRKNNLGTPAGEGDEAVGRLVEVVRGHARSLVLLAPMVAARGLKGTIDELAPLLEELERRSPGDRENSLLASVRLSLGRLPPALRDRARALAVFHGVADAWVLAQVMQAELDAALELGRALVAVGLADVDQSYLLFEPSLVAAVGLPEDERAALRDRWRTAMQGLVESLYRQDSRDIAIAAHGTRVALPELLALVLELERAVEAGAVPVEAAHDTLTRLEPLVERLGRPRALAPVVASRRKLAERLGAWSHARFAHEQLEVENKLAVGDLPGAHKAAVSLLDRAEAAGDAYPDADYDRAMAHTLVGQVLKAGGQAEAALPLLEEARRRFEAVEARKPGRGAAGMAAVCITRQADALRDVGRLDEAAAAYEEAIKVSGELDDKGAVATAKFQLGTLRMFQGRYEDALDAFREGRATFTDLGAPASVATAWHQEAMVHRQAGDAHAAERAYLASLDIETRLGDRAGRASTLDELGNLYSVTGRLEDAANFHHRAASIRKTLGDKRNEAASLNNLAHTLRQLDRLDEARAAIARAIELEAPFGAVGEPWKTQANLANIEAAADNPAAATQARARAIQLYRDFRDGGGSPQSDTGRLVEQLHGAIQAGASPADLAPQLPGSEQFDESALPFRDALKSLLLGQSPNLDDPRLDYTNAAELQRLAALLAARG